MADITDVQTIPPNTYRCATVYIYATAETGV